MTTKNTNDNHEEKKFPEDLRYVKKSRWAGASEEEKMACMAFSEHYKWFLDASKTEREGSETIEQWLQEEGFQDLDASNEADEKAAETPKWYRKLNEKAMLIYVKGKKKTTEGLHIIGAHLDAPRIDLKPNPLMETEGLAYFKTHYYGGIKKYQWATIPLALHGVVVRKDGQKIKVVIGEKTDEPVLVITDLLPHLAKDQMQKNVAEAISGEDLNVLCGGQPSNAQEAKERVKLRVLEYLYEHYRMTEEDFISAELCVVPAFSARDVGFDKSMVGAYGQDDRVSAYAALQAIRDMDTPLNACVCVLADKEEIGSVGNTGSASLMFENFVADILKKQGEVDTVYATRVCMQKSKMLSADVTAAYDPTFASVYEKLNSAFLGNGVVITKYTGARGKAGASDANAEFVAKVRRVFSEADIPWQAAELGKVDQGGGGTIALFFANLGIQVLDCGVGLLSMHAPFEVADKMDIYASYRGFKAFFESDI